MLREALRGYRRGTGGRGAALSVVEGDYGWDRGRRGHRYRRKQNAAGWLNFQAARGRLSQVDAVGIVGASFVGRILPRSLLYVVRRNGVTTCAALLGRLVVRIVQSEHSFFIIP